MGQFKLRNKSLIRSFVKLGPGMVTKAEQATSTFNGNSIAFLVLENRKRDTVRIDSNS